MNIKKLNEELKKYMVENFKNPQSFDELQPGEWYMVEGSKLVEIIDNQAKSSEGYGQVKTWRIEDDGRYQLYFSKSLFPLEKWEWVDKTPYIKKKLNAAKAELNELLAKVSKVKERIANLEAKLDK